MHLPASLVAGNTVKTEASNRVYFPALDGLRGIAFLAVFFHHYGYFAYGWVGVDCFFALSGFLITGILYDTMESPDRVRSFYSRRTLRIFPLYYAVFAALLISAPLVHWQWHSRWFLWPAYLGNCLVLVHKGPVDATTLAIIDGHLTPRGHLPINLGHLWSLCVEEQFYLVWPWVVFLVRNRRALLCICFATIAASPLLRLWALWTANPDRLAAGLLPHCSLFRFDTLLFGAAAALLYRGSARERLESAARPLSWFAGALLLFFLRPPHWAYAPSWFNLVEVWGFSLIGLLSTVVILRSLTPGSLLYKLFSTPFLRWLGQISYGAYVFHDIPHLYYTRFAHDSRPGTALLGLVATLFLATISYRFFESPFLRLKSQVRPAAI